MSDNSNKFLGEAGIKQLYASIKDKIKSEIKIVDDKINNINAGGSDIQKQIESLNNEIYSNTASIAEAEKRLTALDGENGSVASIQKTVTNNSSTLSNHDYAITAQGQILENLKSLTPLPEMKVHFPYKGMQDSGDCIIIQIPVIGSATETKTVMIDLGYYEAANGLKQYLDNKNITHIDCLIISHYHSDHVGGNSLGDLVTLDILKNYFSSETVFYLPHGADTTIQAYIDDLNGETDESDFTGVQSFKNKIETFANGGDEPRGIECKYPNENTELKIENALFKFYNLKPEYFNVYKDTVLTATLNIEKVPNYNNYSMVTSLQYGDKTFLFTGDIEEAAQKNIWQDIPNPDVLKIEHHEFNYRTYDKYINKMTPQYAIICNYATPYGLANDRMHRRATTTALNNISEIYQTNYSGNIVITTDGTTLNLTSDNGRTNVTGDLFLNAAIGVPPLGEDLKNGIVADINKIIIPGAYQVQATSNAKTIANIPCDDSGFKLIVEYLNPGSSEAIRQTLIKSSDSDAFILHRTGIAHSENIENYELDSKGKMHQLTLAEAEAVAATVKWYPWTTMTPFVKGIDIIASGKLTTVQDGELVNDKTDKNATYRDLNNCFDLVTYSSAYGQNETIKIGDKTHDNCYDLHNVPDNIKGGFTLNVHQVSTNRILQMIYDNYGNSAIRPGRLDYASASKFTEFKDKKFSPFYYAESTSSKITEDDIVEWKWIEK